MHAIDLLKLFNQKKNMKERLWKKKKIKEKFYIIYSTNKMRFLFFLQINKKKTKQQNVPSARTIKGSVRESQDMKQIIECQNS